MLLVSLPAANQECLLGRRTWEGQFPPPGQPGAPLAQGPVTSLPASCSPGVLCVQGKGPGQLPGGQASPSREALPSSGLLSSQAGNEGESFPFPWTLLQARLRRLRPGAQISAGGTSGPGPPFLGASQPHDSPLGGTICVINNSSSGELVDSSFSWGVSEWLCAVPPGREREHRAVKTLLTSSCPRFSLHLPSPSHASPASS